MEGLSSDRRLFWFRPPIVRGLLELWVSKPYAYAVASLLLLLGLYPLFIKGKPIRGDRMRSHPLLKLVAISIVAAAIIYVITLVSEREV